MDLGEGALNDFRGGECLSVQLPVGCSCSSCVSASQKTRASKSIAPLL